MKEHELRVVAEHEELTGRMVKLMDFMHGDIYAKLPATDQGLLMVQVRAMSMYKSALEDRIERFEK